jgi:hypothetical protein
MNVLETISRKRALRHWDLSIYGSTALCWAWAVFFSFLILYTVGRIPWTGDQPVARPLPIHRTTQTQNKCTQRHPWLSGIRTHDLSVPAGEDNLCRPLWSAPRPMPTPTDYKTYGWSYDRKLSRRWGTAEMASLAEYSNYQLLKEDDVPRIE